MDNGETPRVMLRRARKESTATMGKQSRATWATRAWRLALLCGATLVACDGEQTD